MEFIYAIKYESPKSIPPSLPKLCLLYVGEMYRVASEAMVDADIYL
jgi:hypothetical protein